MPPMLHTGAIIIQPPLDWSRIHKSPYRPTRIADPNIHIRYHTNRQTVQTRNGPTTHRDAVSLIPTTTDPYDSPHLLDQLNDIIKTHPSHSFTGHIELTHPHNDLERLRYVATGHSINIVHPRITLVWPGDEQRPQRRPSLIANQLMGIFQANPAEKFQGSGLARTLKATPSVVHGALRRLADDGYLHDEWVRRPNQEKGSSRQHDYWISAEGLAWRPA